MSIQGPIQRPIQRYIQNAVGGAVLPVISKNLIDLPLLANRYGSNGVHATLNRSTNSSIQDFEGLTRKILPHEFGFEGARRVESIHLDLVHSVGTATYTEIAPDEFEVENLGTSTIDPFFARFSSRIANSAITVGFSVKATLAEDVGKSFYHRILGSGTNSPSLQGSLTAEYVPYGTLGAISSGVDGSDNLYLYGGATNPTTRLTVKLLRLEVVTDQANQVPSEFIEPNDSACSFQDIPVRYFPYENGNTVDANGVVTEAQGAAIADIKGVEVWEASENIFKSSNDLNLYDYVGGTIHDNESFTPATQYDDAHNTILTTAGTSYTISFKAKTDSNKTIQAFHLFSDSGGATSINTSTEWQSYEITVLGHASSSSVQFGIRDGNATWGKIYVKDFQVEEKSYATPLILTSGAAVSRVADNMQTTWPDGLVNDFVVSCEYYPTDVSSKNYLYTLRTGDGLMEVRVYSGTTNAPQTDKRVAGVSDFIAGSDQSFESHNSKHRISATQGHSSWLDDVLNGTTSANTADLTGIDSNPFSIGKRLAGVEYLNGNIKNISVVKGDLTDEEVINLPGMTTNNIVNGVDNIIDGTNNVVITVSI